MIILNLVLVFVSAALTYHLHQRGFSWTDGFGAKSLNALSVAVNGAAVILHIISTWS